MALPELASIDGRITPTQDASLPLPDDGLYRGDGVFEVMRLYGGTPFALDEHLDRIERSAAAIELPVDRPRVEDELGPLLERVAGSAGQLRIILTRGGRRVLLTEPLASYEETLTLASVTYAPALLLTGVKSISYAANMQATRLAQAKGADEALLVSPDGVVLEAPTSSLFFADAGGRLHTPSLGSGILESITRQKLVEELEVVEGEYRLEEVVAASEAFLASTTREVQAVARVDDTELQGPGPRTRDAEEAFAAIVERELGSVSPGAGAPR